ncbi:MAG: hypothetical protein ACPGU7_08655 [Gammaproteobacteria bacterium]
MNDSTPGHEGHRINTTNASGSNPGNETALGLSTDDLSRIANAVAEKVIKPIVHTVDDEVDRVGDTIVDSIDSLALPDLDALKSLLGDPTDFVHSVTDAVEAGSLEAMARLPRSLENAGMEALDKHQVLALVDALLDALDATEELVEGLGMTIDSPAALAARALQGLPSLLDAIPDSVFRQLRYPGDLLDLDSLTEQVKEQATLLRGYAPKTQVNANRETGPSPGERRFALTASATFFSVAADLLDYLGDAFPLGIAAGGNGGVAAGANITGAVRVHIVKVGTFVFGLIKFVLGVIAQVLTLVNEGMDDLA